MAQTLFADWTSKMFRKVVGKLTPEYINDSHNAPKYIAHNFLTEEWTSNLTFATSNVVRQIVCADVVSMDASIPLKKRPSLQTTRGEVPKIGTKRQIVESELTRLYIMENEGHSDLAKTLRDDVRFCVEGIEAKIEEMFLTALSTGVLLVDNGNGLNGVRVNFGYKPSNIFVAKTSAWSTVASATPIDDLQQLFDKASADGVSIARLFISKTYMDYLRASNQGKQLYANNNGMVITSLANMGKVSAQNMADALKAEFGCEIEVVNQSIRKEVNGVVTISKPFADANIIAVPSDNIGRLVYGTLAEESYPSDGVSYAKNGNYTLVSKWSETDPKLELTKAEAFVIPVLDNASDVYMLKADRTDAISVETDELKFKKSGGSKVVKFNADSSVTATIANSASNTWITASVDNTNGEVTFAVSANTGNAREVNVTLTDAEGASVVVKVSQGAGA